MAIPSVNLFSNLPGGGLNAAMNANNALANNMHLREINRIKAKYAPVTTQAEALSKLAYANLMGPQFLAKMMGNPDIVASLSEPQIKNNINTINRAGNGQGTSTGLLNSLQSNVMPNGEPSGNPLANIGQFIAGKFRGMFPEANNQQAMPTNSLANPEIGMPSQNQAPALPSVRPKGGVSVTGEQWYDKNGNPVYTDEIEDNGVPVDLGIAPQRELTYAEKAGKQKGIIGEGTETGKIRAKDIDNLNTTVFNAETNGETLNQINDILASPEFEQIRQVPLLGHHELSYYAKAGTPEQQQMVGKYYTLTGNLVKDASRDFAGQFRKGEQQLLNGMKPNPNDTVDTAKGKSETLTILNRMLQERSRLTSKIMNQYHVNKLEASEEADKRINGQQIRRDIHDRLNPTVTIINRKTGDKKTVSISEARKLGVPNV